MGALAAPSATARSGNTRQPWPACIRRKWKTTEPSEELSIAPRRPTRQSLKPCYYSSPDGNLPVHLLFSSSRPFHNKKNEISLIFPNYLAMFPSQPFPEKPHNIAAQPRAPYCSPPAQGGKQPVPGASYGDEDGVTGEDTWCLHDGLPRRNAFAALAAVLAGAFWMSRREVLSEVWAGNIRLPQIPQTCGG